ncbi:hypothetical protein SB00610_01037 [Klebsiella quasipneumoniae subsp. similipneumoniae]|nr:hypothetical protein SB00610_01037 [Klebsiella quasipneumoniae subsp. similipneumoniae]
MACLAPGQSFFSQGKASIAWSHDGNENEGFLRVGVHGSVNLPRFRYGNFSGLELGNHTASLVVTGRTRKNSPSVLTVGMNVSGNFLPWTNMPNNDCGLFSFKHHRSNRLAIRWAGKLRNRKYSCCNRHSDNLHFIRIRKLFYTPEPRAYAEKMSAIQAITRPCFSRCSSRSLMAFMIPSWFHPIVVAVFVVSILTHGGQLLEQLR